MKERPILFKSEMVRAILEGRKTQTRRVVKPQPKQYEGGTSAIIGDDGVEFMSLEGDSQFRPFKYGRRGEALWVKETWALHPDEHPDEAGILYRATDPGWDDSGSGLKWKPSIFMPRRVSRITLDIVNVRVEKLQEISDGDAKAEGVQCGIYCGEDDEGPALRSIDCEDDEKLASYQDGFRFTWECINGKGSWELNPWVWVIEFKRVKRKENT